MYKPFFASFLRADIRSAIILLVIFSTVRFLLVLDAVRSGSYQYVVFIFIAMALFTLLALSREGKRRIGLTKPGAFSKIGQVFFWGLVASAIMGLAGNYYFGLTEENWFVYIARSMPVQGPLNFPERVTSFVIFSIIGMIFSPIGEELFYRGVIHESLVPSMGQRGATLADSLAFSLIHLCHFGIYFSDGSWGIHTYPSFLWVGFLVLTCIIFTTARQTAKSIWGAVACHAGYNTGMNAIIFFYIL